MSPSLRVASSNSNDKSLRKISHITDFLHLPKFDRVLSHGNKPIVNLPVANQSSMMAMSAGPRHFWVLCLQSEYGGTAWFNLIEQCKRLPLIFAGAYTCTNDILNVVLQENASELELRASARDDDLDRKTLATIVTESTPIDWLNSTVGKCLQMGASDIHFEVRDDVCAMRIRLDGLLRLVSHYPSRAVISGLSTGYTVLAQEGSRSEVAFNAGLPQSAMIPLVIDGQKLHLRYQSHPCVSGFDASIRILRSGKLHHQDLPQLESLGYTPWQFQCIDEAARSAWGGLFIAGITGSGKTTTLTSILSKLAMQGQRKIISIEDPVEYQVPGVSHFSIQRQSKDSKENPFENAMLAFLRMDPDVGMFGEIRDRISGQMAHAAIQTGHKLLTTVHATSALGIVARLTSQHIGLLREDVCGPDFLSLLVYQVLMPLNCVHCKIPSHQVMAADQLAAYEKIFQMDTAGFFSASEHGCQHCQVPGLTKNTSGHAGIKGVKVCAEVIPASNEILALLHQGKDLQARQYWLCQRQNGFDSPDMLGKESWGHALFDISQGRVDPYHFERTFGTPALIARSRSMLV